MLRGHAAARVAEQDAHNGAIIRRELGEWPVRFREDVISAIIHGHLIAISGPVGVGKTMMVSRLQDQIRAERKIIVARSLSVAKHRVTLPALITAQFLDISRKPEMKLPIQSERRSGCFRWRCARPANRLRSS
ncbi:MAG: hypothetical protein OXL68_03630 [Paracoccaceae bacterium]|nr:hypothetical protein [Paracoccaceae bacterium]